MRQKCCSLLFLNRTVEEKRAKQISVYQGVTSLEIQKSGSCYVKELQDKDPYRLNVQIYRDFSLPRGSNSGFPLIITKINVHKLSGLPYMLLFRKAPNRLYSHNTYYGKFFNHVNGESAAVATSSASHDQIHNNNTLKKKRRGSTNSIIYCIYTCGMGGS